MSTAIGKKINAIIPWSSISSIGNSTPARLTILAPLIGYLVIYNQFIADFFFLSNTTPDLPQESPSLLDLFRELKLTFLYFGLLLFGIGAMLFAAYAPRNIRKYKSPEEYLLKMEAAQTEWLIVDNLTRVGRAAWKGEYFESPSRSQRSQDRSVRDKGQSGHRPICATEPSYGNTSLSFTEDTLYQLDAILEFAGHNAFSDSEEPVTASEPDPDLGFYNALGNVMTDRVLECILSKRRVDRAIWHNSVGVIVEHRARDVFYLAYTFDEWSRFGARLACASMFLLGGILLAIPTVITSLEVISQAWK
jgi:hypothetical protein